MLSKVSPLGIIEGWFYRVEFQQRGLPHIHMLLWVDGAPKFGVDSDEKLLSLLRRLLHVVEVKKMKVYTI